MLHYFVDPEAADRSLMNKHKSVCDGTATGYQCEHYWAMIKKVDVQNPDHLRDGEKIRYCLVDPGEVTFLGDGGLDMPWYCTKYKRSSRKFDKFFSDYKPLTPEEITELQSKSPAVVSDGGFINFKKLFSRK